MDENEFKNFLTKHGAPIPVECEQVIEKKLLRIIQNDYFIVFIYEDNLCICVKQDDSPFTMAPSLNFEYHNGFEQNELIEALSKYMYSLRNEYLGQLYKNEDIIPEDCIDEYDLYLKLKEKYDN